MQASISYSDLHDASQQAHKVSKRLDDYADELQSKVLNKISNYNGPWTSNMSDAYDLISNKINELRTDCTRFETYSTDLDNLLNECKSVDEAVKTRIAKLTGDFKDAHGIRNSAIENCLAYTFTAIGNSSAAGRFLGNGRDINNMVRDYLLQELEIWFDYEGGKEFIKTLVVDALIVVGAILTLVGAIISGGTLFIIAAAVLLVIALVDVGIDIAHEIMALQMNQNSGDASWAYRLREISSFSDLMKNGLILDEHDLTKFNQSYAGRRKASFVWNGVKFACNVVVLVYSLPTLFENIGKLSTLSQAIKFKEVTKIAEAVIVLDISKLDVATVAVNSLRGIIEDGFQISDLLNLDRSCALPTFNDLLTNDDYASVIERLRIVLPSGGMNLNVRVAIPQISLPSIVMPSIQMPVIQVPHLPVMSFSF